MEDEYDDLTMKIKRVLYITQLLIYLMNNLVWEKSLARRPRVLTLAKYSLYTNHPKIVVFCN